MSFLGEPKWAIAAYKSTIARKWLRCRYGYVDRVGPSIEQNSVCPKHVLVVHLVFDLNWLLQKRGSHGPIDSVDHWLTLSGDGTANRSASTTPSSDCTEASRNKSQYEFLKQCSRSLLVTYTSLVEEWSVDHPAGNHRDDLAQRFKGDDLTSLDCVVGTVSSCNIATIRGRRLTSPDDRFR